MTHTTERDLMLELISAAYPIPHDEGCYLDPDFGESNFAPERNTILDQLPVTEIEEPEPYCNCGTDQLNATAASLLETN